MTETKRRKFYIEEELEEIRERQRELLYRKSEILRRLREKLSSSDSKWVKHRENLSKEELAELEIIRRRLGVEVLIEEIFRTRAEQRQEEKN